VAEIDLGIGLGDEIGEEIVQIDIDGIRGVGPYQVMARGSVNTVGCRV